MTLNSDLTVTVDVSGVSLPRPEFILGPRKARTRGPGSGRVLAERHTVHTHAATGAETRCYRVLRKDRNRPLPLAEALEAARAASGWLLINEQSHRAAVQVPGASLMHDDGRVEPRIRLIRPMARETVSLEHLAHSHWREAAQPQFAPLWEAECSRVPEFSESGFHIITGLLLPI